MRRRNFLKGMVGAAALVAVPVTFLPQVQALAQKSVWRIVATERNIRRQATDVLFRKDASGYGGEWYEGYMSVPFMEEMTPDERVSMFTEMYP